MAVKLKLRATGSVDWRGERHSDRPSKFESIGDISPSEAGLCAPFRERFCLASVSNEAGASSVAGLLFVRGPSAIIRSVPFRPVDTVKRFAFRSLSHISKKVGEILPTITDRYFAEVIRLGRAYTARLHGVPRSICRTVRHSFFVLAELRSFVPFPCEAPA